MRTLTLDRITTDDKPTLGVLREDQTFLCFTVEDRHRTEKVRGDTRIPAGTYPLKWRTSGKWAKRFQRKGFPGSLEICDVPNFTDVLLHIGNDKGDTEGCPLPNLIAYANTRTGGQSALACAALYRRVAANDGPWEIEVRDPNPF